jgi:DNA replication protein DnaC
MDISCRNRSLLLPVTFYACVPVNPGLSREQHFEKWLDELSPRYCGRHKRTLLMLNRETSRRSSLSVAASDIWYRRYMDPRQLAEIPDRAVIEKFHPFEACFRCPACKLQYAQVPPLFYESCFDAFQAGTPELKHNLAKCREFILQVNGRGCGFLLMSGLVGTGKTMLACCVIRELNHNNSLYIRQAQLTNALRESYGRKDVFIHGRGQVDDGDAIRALLDVVQQVGFLILDEIGCTVLANDEKRLLDELIKYRFEHNKPTILISNLPLKGKPEKPGLKEIFGDALTDRIREATGNGKFILQFAGKSYRPTTGENYLQGLR